MSGQCAGISSLDQDLRLASTLRRSPITTLRSTASAHGRSHGALQFPASSRELRESTGALARRAGASQAPSEHPASARPSTESACRPPCDTSQADERTPRRRRIVPPGSEGARPRAGRCPASQEARVGCGWPRRFSALRAARAGKHCPPVQRRAAPGAPAPGERAGPRADSRKSEAGSERAGTPLRARTGAYRGRAVPRGIRKDADAACMLSNGAEVVDVMLAPRSIARTLLPTGARS